MMKAKMVLVALLGLNALSAVAAETEGMELSGNAWAAWMRGNMVVNGQYAQVVRDSGNYFEDLSVGGTLELALRNNKMVLLGYVDYFDPISSDVMVGNQAGTLDTSEILGCIAVGYPLAPPGGKSTFDIFIGFQGMRVDNELWVGGGVQNASTDVYDSVLMLRSKMQLGTKFYLYIPLSFGLSFMGESELVYDAGLQLSFQATKNLDVRAGYRISGFKYQEDTLNHWDFYQQGYTLGLGLTF